MNTKEVLKKVYDLRNRKGDWSCAIKILEGYLQGKDLSANDEVLILKELGSLYRDVGKVSEAMNFYNKALKIAKELKDDEEYIDVARCKGFLILKTVGKKEALKYVLKFRKKAEALEISEAKINYYAVLGNIYFDSEEYEKALEIYEENLIRAYDVGFLLRIITLCGDIANVYIKLNRGAEALDLIDKNIELAKKEYLIAVPQLYLRKGNIYVLSKNYDRAEGCLNTALEFSITHKLPRDIAESYEALGKLYDLIDKEEKAKEYYKKAIKYYSKIGYKDRINRLKAS